MKLGQTNIKPIKFKKTSFKDINKIPWEDDKELEVKL